MKANFRPRCSTPVEILDRNISHAATLGLPFPKEKERQKLAVVGGGHSIVDNIETLRSWDGDIWACGSAFPWCLKTGIDATYFCVDANELAFLVVGAKKAIVSTTTAPSVFAALKDAEVEVFDLYANEEEANHGTTSMTATAHLAISIGYKDITFFGADSSFIGDSHAYGNYNKPLKMQVKVGDALFITDPELFMQAELLASMIRLAPHVFKEESGGLLRALVGDMDYDIVAVSPALMAIKE